ncbi:hypothetical protein [Nocardia sp. BMG51109]|uniref:hypothetical protein n=1 Tax=Nocardia sp. BMG51109 TaxID=1056816 RepID=UPI0004B4EA3C|nr:hypothetical protein [Nocardia sp. BMG51109]
MDLVGMRRVPGTYDAVVPPVVDTVRAHGESLIARAAHIARTVAPSLRVTTELSEAAPARLLAAHSATAYITVLGAVGTGRMFAHPGSILLAVTAHGHGTVLVVRGDTKQGNVIRTSGPVVVGIDGSPVGEAAIAEAAERRADLVAVHVWIDWDYERSPARTTLASRRRPGNGRAGHPRRTARRVAGEIPGRARRPHGIPAQRASHQKVEVESGE